MKDGERRGREILSIGLPRMELSARGLDPIEFEVLSLDDVETMRDRLALEPAEFVITTLEHQARLEPGGFRIRGLPGATILRFARTWAAHPSTLAASPGSIVSYRDFHAASAGKIAEWDETLRGLSERLSAAMVPIIPKWEISPRIQRELGKIRSVSRGLAKMMEEVNDSLAALGVALRPSWPDPGLLSTAFRQAEAGKSHLDDHGYGFVVGDWGLPALREIARDQPQAREVHREFLHLTRHATWAEPFLARAKASPALKRRLPILTAAYRAHLARDYALSVPALYAQLEGILTDLLVLEGRARRRGHKVHRRGGGELTGLTKKAKHYGKGESAARAFITGEILEELSPDRNAVLHGSKTGYCQASRSARLLLMVDVLMKLVLGLEKDHGNS